MLEKLKAMKIKYMDLTHQLAEPEIIADRKLYTKLAKEHSALEEIIQKYSEYEKAIEDQQSAESLRAVETDHEMLEMIDQELQSLKEKQEQIIDELKILMLPKDENDEKNVIIEIRSGAGGDEASLFGLELKRMYTLYAESKRLTLEEIDSSYTEAGGLKEATFMLKGHNAYAKMKFESGVHRVQRVPVTESQGRVHTSTVTVAVLPEAPQVDIEIDEKDLQIDTYRSSGAGGQHVNKTESAIRMTHIPTGIIVNCQDERSQIKNREKALNYLKSKLYDYYQTQADSEYAKKRRLQIGTGDRSEKIRTYNFPQNRVTDHRINFTLYSLEDFMNGNLDEMIEALTIAERQKLLMGDYEA